MMEMFSGMCSLVFLLWLSVSGMVLKMVVIVVIRMGFSCSRVV